MERVVEASVACCRRAGTVHLPYVEGADYVIAMCTAVDAWALHPRSRPLLQTQIPETRLNPANFHHLPGYLPEMLPLAKHPSCLQLEEYRVNAMLANLEWIVTEGLPVYALLCFSETCRSIKAWAQVALHVLLACLDL
jgi:hypothetical protein